MYNIFRLLPILAYVPFLLALSFNSGFLWTSNGNGDIRYTSGDVSVGTSSSNMRLTVETDVVNEGISLFNSVSSDDSSVPFFISGKNSAGTTSNVSIEAINLLGVLSEMIIRTGSATQVGFGPERTRISGKGLRNLPPVSETIAAAATITDDGCGTVKRIDSVGAVTTGTTDTFTRPTSANAGCIMIVCNVDTVDTITLDNNVSFVTDGGVDIALTPNDCIEVNSDGSKWRQANPKSTNS